MTARLNTAAWRLWHIQYNVYIPRSLMSTREYNDKVGYHVTGDPGVDSAMNNALMLQRQTGAGIAVLYRDGAPLETVFQNPKDRIPLYRDIQEHLINWREQIFNNVHPGALPPLSDFRMLEAVARGIHPYVAKANQAMAPESDIRDRLLAMNQRRNPNFNASLAKKQFQTEDGHIKPYVSIVDDIERLVMED